MHDTSNSLSSDTSASMLYYILTRMPLFTLTKIPTHLLRFNFLLPLQAQPSTFFFASNRTFSVGFYDGIYHMVLLSFAWHSFPLEGLV